MMWVIDIFSNKMPADARQTLRVNKTMTAEDAAAGDQLLHLFDMLTNRPESEAANLLGKPQVFHKAVTVFIGIKMPDVKKWVAVLKRTQLRDALLELCRRKWGRKCFSVSFAYALTQMKMDEVRK